MTRVMCVLALAVVALQAQAPPAEEPKKARVEGVVVNATTGEPLRKATVVLQRSEGVYAAVSDTGGKFVIDNIPAGTYSFLCTHSGFLTAQYGARRAGGPGAELFLQAGQEVKDVIFRLTAQGVITGRVVDDEGDPVTDVMVQPLRRGYARPGVPWRRSAMVRTNDIGEFRLANLEPGKYIVLSGVARMSFPSTPPQPKKDEGGETALVRTYYPSASDASQAAVLDVAPGQELSGIEIRLVRSRVVRVSGRVVSPIGAPAKRAMVSISSKGGQPGTDASSAMTEEPDGRFTLVNVTPGSHLISASVMVSENEWQTNTGQQLEVPAQNVEGVVIQLVAPQKISGRVTVEGPTKPKLSSFRVALSGIDGFSGSEEAKVNEDGSFALGASPGKYHLEVYNGEDNTWLKSAKAGEAEVKDRTLDVASGTTDLQIVLGSDPARIDGRVTDKDGGPVLGARVVLLPSEGQDRFRAAVQMSGRDGLFTFQGLSPGEYKIYAWDDVEYGAWFDAEFRKPYEEKATAVNVKAGETATVNVEMQAGPR